MGHCNILKIVITLISPHLFI